MTDIPGTDKQEESDSDESQKETNNESNEEKPHPNGGTSNVVTPSVTTAATSAATSNTASRFASQKHDDDSDSDSDSSDHDSSKVPTTRSTSKKVAPTPAQKIITETEDSCDDDKPKDSIKSLKTSSVHSHGAGMTTIPKALNSISNPQDDSDSDADDSSKVISKKTPFMNTTSASNNTNQKAYKQ